jgi:hypothetical protein
LVFFSRGAKGIFKTWISEVDGREGAHSRRSALPRPPSADTDASNTVGSSERRAVGSPAFQLRAGLRVRSPGRISLLELSKATFHVVLSRRRRVDGSRARARAPGRRARPPRRCRQAQRVDAQGTRPSDPSHASPPFGSALGARGLRRVASWPKGQFITWPPGVLVVSPAETYRAYRAVPGRPNVSRRSRVVTRSPRDPERRPEDRVEHPLTRSTPPRVTLRRRPP